MNFECLKNSNNQQADVIITTVPWTDSNIPLMAPAVLKPVVEQAGFSCLAIDLNAEVFSKTSKIDNITDLLKFFFDNQCPTKASRDWIFDLLESAADQMLVWKPRYIGLSLFSYVCRSSALWLCYLLKKKDPEVKILLGGAGCLEQFTGPSDFAEDLISAGLADFHIRGDGENSLYELLKGNTDYPGINDSSWKQLEKDDIAKLPCPDYGDYNFSYYKKKVLPLQGSRGCVRQCTFCDYIVNWPKFRWRTAEDIFNEMLLQYQKYGIRKFKFQDTLTNGNLKEFTKLTQILADYNNTNQNESFRWSGYYIFREKSASDDRMWQLLAESGAEVLSVGIENINEEIRYAIGKKFSNESIDYHLQKALDYGIKIGMLFIVGYVNETQEHIDFAKRWLDTHTQYQPAIATIQWGAGLGIFPNTYLEKNKENLGIKMIGSKPHMWINPSTGSNPAMRAQWAIDLNEHSKKLGYTVSDYIDNHFLLEQLINDTNFN